MPPRSPMTNVFKMVSLSRGMKSRGRTATVNLLFWWHVRVSELIKMTVSASLRLSTLSFSGSWLRSFDSLGWSPWVGNKDTSWLWVVKRSSTTLITSHCTKCLSSLCRDLQKNKVLKTLLLSHRRVWSTWKFYMYFLYLLRIIWNQNQ